MLHPYSRRFTINIVFVFMIFIFIFCQNLFSLNSDNNYRTSEYHIGIGDVIEISVWQYEQFNTKSTVAPDGKISMPLIGEIVADSKTRKELKDEITIKLSKFVKEGAEVTVNITQFNSQKISIFGSVANSRVLTFSSPPSLLELMINAAPTSDADLTAVKILPADTSIRKPIIVNLSNVLLTGNTSELPDLHPGDVIYVPKIEKQIPEMESQFSSKEPDSSSVGTQMDYSATEQKSKFMVNVMGSVVRTGMIESPQELSLPQVLTQAGGVTDNKSLKNIRVIRSNSMSEERIVNVDLDKYLIDGDSSILPRLYSGDTVYVPPLTSEDIRKMSIIIIGEVVSPGSYLTSEPLDILNAISMAGGLTAMADPSKIRIRRESVDDYQDKTVDLDEFIKDVKVSYRPEMIGPGYIIYVPSKERGMTTKTAIATRGIIAFLADLVPIYGLYRLITQ